jgi:2,3-bisphosphoglycerate-independent phosphoglycerate mutase
MTSILFFFLDGIGLGKADPLTNPFANTRMPALEALLGGKKLVQENIPLESERATLLGLDAGLGVDGLPQSATGQATLLNGENVPASIGNHYGPKPNPAVAEIVSESNLFIRLKEKGRQVAFLNAFPPSYFDGVKSGRRLYGTIALAAARAGVPLRTMDDLRMGNAVSADFTGEGLRDRLNIQDAPIISLKEAGKRLAHLSQAVDFALFEYWLTDFAGHGQDMQVAMDLLAAFDQVFGALAQSWNDDAGLIVFTSDHGNMEDLSTRRHTENKVPCLIIGDQKLRREFASGLNDLTGIAPAIQRLLD